MQSGKLTVVAEIWMRLYTISIPHVKASTSRVLVTSTINNCHWALFFTAHKKTMGRIKKDNQYFNHMKVIGPWENKNWILLVPLMFCYRLVWKNARLFYASRKRTCRVSFTYRPRSLGDSPASAPAQRDSSMYDQREPSGHEELA